jgi:electron transfer flavoprotein alpha subunit
MNAKGAIGVVVEGFGERIRPVSYEAAACAMKLGKICELPVKGIVPGRHPVPLAEEFAKTTGLDTLALEGEDLGGWSAESWRDLSAILFDSGLLSGLVAAHTVRAGECVHALAASCNARAFPGVESLERRDEGLYFRRSIFGSKLLENLPGGSPPYFILTQPGAFPASLQKPQKPGEVGVLRLKLRPSRIRLLKTESGATAGAALVRADVIVAAGRGIGVRENIEQLEKFAAGFSGAAVGASRPLCDMGWLGYDRQVGQTGATVTPKVYIACGISGSSQHVAGMRGSKFVVAVNKDPAAAIFQHADVGVVEDVNALISAILEVLGES